MASSAPQTVHPCTTPLAPLLAFIRGFINGIQTWLSYVGNQENVYLLVTKKRPQPEIPWILTILSRSGEIYQAIGRYPQA